MIKIYTLKNCDTCKKSLKWLDSENISYENHDIRADGLSRAAIEEIVSSLGWETALNRRSTTWRSLSDSDKADITNEKAIDLIEANPTLMKRPVTITDKQTLAGFDDAMRAAVG